MRYERLRGTTGYDHRLCSVLPYSNLVDVGANCAPLRPARSARTQVYTSGKRAIHFSGGAQRLADRPSVELE